MIVAEQAVERMVVAASPERCFETVADLDRYPEWAADIKSVKVNTRDREGRPGEVEFRAAAFGRSTTYTLAYDFSEAPTAISWKLVSGDLTSKLDGSYRFMPSGESSTEVTYSLEVELRVPLPSFIKRRAQGRIMHTALVELKARVESGG
jgi:ribosome-associated toxin RatA of RatAB toxin-antitoxin module